MRSAFRAAICFLHIGRAMRGDAGLGSRQEMRECDLEIGNKHRCGVECVTGLSSNLQHNHRRKDRAQAAGHGSPGRRDTAGAPG